MNKARSTVLVVDDDMALRHLLVRTLRHKGIEPIGACDGADALEAFLAHRNEIDLVILDMQMPRMNGLDLAAELERRQPGVKILYISGLGASIAVESIQRTAAERVLLKPFEPQTLVERVLFLLGRDDVPSGRDSPQCKRESA